ncbi:MAG: glycosyltransferase [Elusimicrobia bacterium]|nr:glycosyltransferase [Elusimicrobiota bacterium]
MDDQQPLVSIIIPVINEEDSITSCIGHINSLDHNESFEIIVVDGHEHATTIKTIRHPRVIKITSQCGRAVQMNTGAQHARGNMLLFLHADTRMPPESWSFIESVSRDRDVIGGAFDLCIDSPKNIFHLISRVASVRSRITRVPYGDQAIFIRKDYFFSIGCFASIPIMEDVELMRRIKKNKGRITISHYPVTTSARRWEQEGIIHATVRNWFISFLFWCGAPPSFLARLYRTKKPLHAS